MLKRRITSKHHHFHWIHFFAGLVLGSYFVLSKVNLAHALLNKNAVESFLQIYTFGIFFGCLFLYIFSHENFFPFAKDIEKKEMKKEKKYLKKYINHGKILTTFIIGVIGGPVFSSLTARLLLNKNSYKYLIVIVSNLLSTVITVGLTKPFVGLFSF